MIVPHAVSEADRIVFLHIPKTAGTSTANCFIDMFGPSQVGWMGVNFPFEDLADGDKLKRFRVIGGHFTKAQTANWRFPAVHVSVVREPVARVLSYYQHILNTPGEAEQLGITGDLDADLNDGFGAMVKNQQSAFLDYSGGELSDDGRMGVCRMHDLPALLAFLARKLNIGARRLPVLNVRRGPGLSIGTATRDSISRLTKRDARLYALARTPLLQRLGLTMETLAGFRAGARRVDRSRSGAVS